MKLSGKITTVVYMETGLQGITSTRGAKSNRSQGKWEHGKEQHVPMVMEHKGNNHMGDKVVSIL